SFHDVARELSAATGRTITYIPVSVDDYRAALRQLGEPEEFADLFTLIVDGRNASVVHGVREALGREPKDFADYAKEAAAAGAWNA
ncbi:NmrA family transcriptional regulator, partial [Streptomyces sp. SID7982]|nr:NmrA family transcriptional regulator [Streptomyces sp. SID7982]